MPWRKLLIFYTCFHVFKARFLTFQFNKLQFVCRRHHCLFKKSYLNNSTKPTCIANIFQPNWPTINSPPVIGIGIFSPDFTAFSLWAFSFCRGCLVHPILCQHTTHQKRKKLKNSILYEGCWQPFISSSKCQINFYWVIIGNRVIVRL